MHVGWIAYKSKQQYTMADKDGTRHVLEPTRLERDIGVLVSDDLKQGDQVAAATAW